jgi:hypothetical protein
LGSVRRIGAGWLAISCLGRGLSVHCRWIALRRILFLQTQDRWCGGWSGFLFHAALSLRAAAFIRPVPNLKLRRLV